MIVWFSWIISICEIYGEYGTAGHLEPVWKRWPAVELKKVLSVTNHSFVFWAQREPNAILQIYKVFQDRLTYIFSVTLVPEVFLDFSPREGERVAKKNQGPG